MKQILTRLQEIWKDLSRGAEGRLPRLWFLLIVDVLGAALILALLLGIRFLPARLAVRRTAVRRADVGVAQIVTPTPRPEPTATPEPSPVITAAPAETPVPALSSVGETAEGGKRRTPWQIKFAEHFSDTPILTENSYHSPEVSIDISTRERLCEYGSVVYYVADIYVASLDNFKTTTANGVLEYTATMHAEEMDEQSNAILAINGDFLTLNDSGFYVRNGEIYRRDPGRGDICVLYPSGVIETWQANTFRVDEILALDPVQVWQFGPALLDDEGHARQELFRIVNSVGLENPRAALGYYEPGHYCFVVVDGRSAVSVGIRLLEFAEIFEELGCSQAYNMDGGGSTVMMFNHEVYNKRNSRRTIGDLILVTEDGFPRAGEEALS